MASKGYTIKSWMKTPGRRSSFLLGIVSQMCCSHCFVLTFLLPTRIGTFTRQKHQRLFSCDGVLQEVQQRCFAVSIIWLHDGFWISSTVRDDIIREAEQTALKSFFPDSCQGERLLRITSLSEEVAKAKRILGLLSSHQFYSLIVVTIDGEPQSSQGSSQRPSLVAARYPNAKQLLILPALQNGSGPNSYVESQYVVAVTASGSGFR